VTIASIANGILRRIFRLGSFVMTLFGVYTLTWADFRSDTLVMVLFCAMPLLSFPVTLLFFRRNRAAAVAHAALALVYLTVYSMLDWRTCTGFGDCQSVAQTVAVTLTSWRVEGMFVVALAAAMLAWSESRPALKPV
jgi:hypothetical protein